MTTQRGGAPPRERDTDAAEGLGAALWAILVAAALVRIYQYLTRGSLWSDEAMLALNVASRSFPELTQPLTHDQYAPLLFLWLQKAVVDVVGVSDRALRVLPLIGGLALVPIVALTAQRLWGRRGALVAATIAAFCPALIYYSSEAKPYGLDALVSAALVAVLCRLPSSPSRKQLIVLAFAGMAASWVSSIAVFTLAGVGLALLLRRSLSPAWLITVSALGLLWVGSFLTAYRLVYARAAKSDYIRQFWADTYLRAGSLEELDRSFTTLLGVVHGVFVGADSVVQRLIGAGPVVILVWLLVGCLLALGVAQAGRHHGWWALALLVGPSIALACASMAGVYPLVARLALFATPMWIVLLAGGILRAAQLAPRHLELTVVLVLALLLPLIGIPREGLWLLRLEQHNQAREAIQLLDLRNQGRAPVYINALGLPVWLFYTTDWSAPDRQRLATLIAWNQRGGPAFENAPSRGQPVSLGEGAKLILHRRGTELLGLPTGMQLRSKAGIVQQQPDSGWVRNEVWRLQRTGAREVWLFFDYAVDRSPEYLRQQLASAGAAVVDSIARAGVQAYRYDLAGTSRTVLRGR